jgi:hypothetical protein
MLQRCEAKALACEQACDQEYSDVVNDNSPRSAQYRACNDKCEDRVRKCRKRVDEINPARTGGEGGGSEGDDPLVLSPDSDDPPPNPPGTFNRPGSIFSP